MKPIAIVQARMGSTRLPGKVLMHLAGKPVLAHVVERLSYCRTLSSTVVATTTEQADDAVASFCEAARVPCYRGSLDDVLDRYCETARAYGADPVVRITADCPAIDPVIVDAVVTGFHAGKYDLYGLDGEFPDGLDTSVFSAEALFTAGKEAALQSEREHVGPYILKHPERFRVGGLRLFQGMAHHRWTLDEPRDYEFLGELFRRLYRSDLPFLTHDVLALLEQNPELMSVNQGIVRNAGYLKSLAKDKKISL